MSAFTEVRGATRDDVVAVARIHKARFGTADYTLGQFSFSLIGKFYAEFLGRCVFLVHASDGRIDGFVVGGLPSEIFAVQRRFSFKHLPQCGLEVLCRPHLWPAAYRFIRRSFLPQPTKFVHILAPHLPRLLSIAVDEAAQGGGVAAALVRAFESSICRRHAGYTLSVLKTNQRAVRFYEKLGLEIVVDALPRSFVFQKQFEPSDNGRSPEPYGPPQ
jgi:ribosomal protein S18 acetylase RimI-like enzyme